MFILGLIFVMIASCLYTVAIFTEKSKGVLNKWMVLVLILGFILYFFGISLMFLLLEENISSSVEAIASWMALGMMFSHLIWAFLTLKIKSFGFYFNKYSILVWFIWVLLLIIGIPQIN